ncbi:hypothetical protein F5B22DRAFT_606509 [Xylaria bambusicola]|uniref:uncharacterized protein n=1 Tax=Xylaria bambusicola TaxID=326684 RepID=UPI002008C1D1|nr:uncharacterized protein F5B22DRAFT_606509 [Xylaria bambusicola]KAI0516790.1 hypothetical protein F5B22DRAFT_606509 [Xylaria bambusicola]
MIYKVHFIPLGPNSDLFTKLMYALRVSTAVTFHYVWYLNDPELLSLVPRPVSHAFLFSPHRVITNISWPDSVTRQQIMHGPNTVGMPYGSNRRSTMPAVSTPFFMPLRMAVRETT